MRKLLFGLILFGSLPIIIIAQEVKEIIEDTIEKTTLFNASTVLIRQRYSIGVSCTRADNKGAFVISDIPKRENVLMNYTKTNLHLTH